MKTEATYRPLLAAAIGVAFLAILDATMREISRTYPLSQSVGLRYLAGSAFALVIYFARRGGVPARDAVWRCFLRSIILIVVAACFFTALARLPFVEAITLTFLAPLFMALLGRFILSEPLNPRTLVGIAVGLAGVVVIAHGQQVAEDKQFDLLGLAAALGCAFFYALSMVLTRKQSSRDSVETIVTLTNVLAFLLILPLMAWQWQPMTGTHVAMLFLVGLAGTAGHMCLTWAYSRAHAGKLGLLEYTAFIWAMIIGYFVFAEIPSSWTLAGSGLIIGACLYALIRR